MGGREGERTEQIPVPSRSIASTCSFARTLLQRPFQACRGAAPPAVAPMPAGQLQMLLPSEYLAAPAAAIAQKLVHTCTTYSRAPLTACAFHPNSTRVVTGNRMGDFGIWEIHNGFKMQRQFAAHHGARLNTIKWSHNELYCLSGDDKGTIKCAAQPRAGGA